MGRMLIFTDEKSNVRVAMGVEMRLLLMKKSKLACYEILFIFLEDNILTSPKICPKYICKDSSYGTFEV